MDLEKFLAWPTNSEHIKVVKDWANRHQLEAMEQETGIAPIEGRQNDLPRKVGLAKEGI